MCAVLKTSRTILTIAHIWRIILSYYKQQEAYITALIIMQAILFRKDRAFGLTMMC